MSMEINSVPEKIFILTKKSSIYWLALGGSFALLIIFSAAIFADEKSADLIVAVMNWFIYPAFLYICSVLSYIFLGKFKIEKLKFIWSIAALIILGVNFLLMLSPFFKFLFAPPAK